MTTPKGKAPSGQGDPPGTMLRLDSLVNPFAPPPAVRNLRLENAPERVLSEKLVESIAARHGLPPNFVVLGRSIEDLVEAIGAQHEGGTSTLVASPNLETGKLLSVTEAIRLARSCDLLIIDERAGGFAHRDHLPLFREFQSVVLIRSFDSWIEPAGGRLSYLLSKRASPGWLRMPDVDSMRMGLATLADHLWVHAAIRQTAKERVRLTRALRKLNMIRPLPGAAGFVAARVERGERTALHEFLDARGILLHYPNGDDVADLVRISAASAMATSTLSAALIEWARTLDG